MRVSGNCDLHVRLSSSRITHPAILVANPLHNKWLIKQSRAPINDFPRSVRFSPLDELYRYLRGQYHCLVRGKESKRVYNLLAIYIRFLKKILILFMTLQTKITFINFKAECNIH